LTVSAGSFVVEKGVGALRPHHAAVGTGDQRVGHGADEAALRVGGVLAVFGRQFGLQQAVEVERGP
jgi:hypothetical protein